MNNVKDNILNTLNMIDVLKQYNIKTNGSMFYCPFHQDKTPSAKFYNNTYFCFACQNGGDLIQFVEDYFGLNFKDALRKINYDFNLKLNFKKLSQSEIDEFNKKKMMKEQQKKIYIKKMLELCNKSIKLESEYRKKRKEIMPYNWEETEYDCSLILNQLELINIEFENMNTKQY